MHSHKIKEKIDASYTLLDTQTTSVEKYESIRRIIEGINPHIDKQLKTVSKAITAYQKISNGQIIELTAEHLPEKTEKEKKRKKALLFLIQSWTQLKGEVQRVRNELEQTSRHNSVEENVIHAGKIIKFAKGPYGLITLAAIIIVGFSLLSGPKNPLPPTHQTSMTTPTVSQHITTYILFNNKKIPLTELIVKNGPDCGGGGIPHYHAANEPYVTALDGTKIRDPGSCAFGKVSETKVLSE